MTYTTYSAIKPKKATKKTFKLYFREIILMVCSLNIKKGWGIAT